MTACLFNNQNGNFANVVDGYVYPQFIGYALRAPTSQDIYPPGTRWQDNSVNPPIIYETTGGGTWTTEGANHATTTNFGTVILTDNSEPVATKAYADALAIAGAPVATTTTAGIGELATNAEAVAGTPSTGLLALFVTPSNLAAVFAAPPATGGTTPAAGTFTSLTTDGTGVVSLAANAASNFTVTGAAADLTLESSGGSVVITGTEAAVDAIQLNATTALGGIDVNAGTGGMTIDSGGLLSLDSAGTTNLTTTGAFDLTVQSTAGSVIISASEDVADAIQILSTAGGMAITATGEAGQDISIQNNGGSVNIGSTENAALAIYLHANGGASETIELRADQGTADTSVYLLSDVGGVTVEGGKAAATAVNLVTTNGAGGITMSAGTGGILPTTSGKFTVISTDNAAQAIELHANGGVTETIRLRADQGTSATSLDLLSDVGGITLNAGLASASAINITSSAVGGGWTLNSGTAGVTLTNTGKLSLAAAAASDITVTGAFNLTLASTLGRVIATSGIAASNAITLTASNAAGGFSLTSGTGGVTLTNTGALSLQGSGASNITIATGDFSLTDTANSIIITAGEAVADAIQLTTSNAAGGLTASLGTGGLIATTTGAISLDGQTASHLKVTGAADLTLQSTAGAINVISGEANADSINITSGGGMNIVATGAAAKDIIVTNTNGSMTLTAGENVSDAFNLTASGAASGMTLTAGTSGLTFASGQNVKVTSVATAATPYAVLGTDYFITTDTTGGVLTLTLPAAPATGRTLIVYDGAGQAATGGAVTINGNGKNIAAAGTSAATKTISTAYGSYQLTYNGTLWLGRFTA